MRLMKMNDCLLRVIRRAEAYSHPDNRREDVPFCAIEIENGYRFYCYYSIVWDLMDWVLKEFSLIRTPNIHKVDDPNFVRFDVLEDNMSC